MNKDYGILLESLMGRRYDEALRESIVSEAFEDTDYSDALKYALECMQEIDPSYTYKTFHIAKRLQDRLTKRFKEMEMKVDFRYQGPIQTETHVVLYGGVELMVLTDGNKPKPWTDVVKSAQIIMDDLTGDQTFKEIDYTSKVKIKITTLKPTCEIKILPAVWLSNEDFAKTHREIDRAVCEYNLLKKTRKRYLPFLNIARINAKDSRCNGGIKRMTRLLRSLQRDSTEEINLSGHEVCSMMYAIPEKYMMFDPKYSLALLAVVATQLDKIASDDKYRSRLLTPSGKAYLFGNRPIIAEEVSKLRRELHYLIGDLNQALKPDGKNIYSEIEYE